jgi:hypothetical protein
MALGRPIQLTGNVASKVIRVLSTANQTVFTVIGGYRINQLGVFRNGVRLSNNSDFVALDGVTVTLVNAAQTDDEVLFQIQDDFKVADAIVSSASTQTINGDLTLNGTLYGSTKFENLTITNNLTTGNINSSGIVTAVSFSGSNANFTTLNATTVSVAGTISYEDVSNVDSVGIITARSGINVPNGGIDVVGVITSSEYDGYFWLDSSLF